MHDESAVAQNTAFWSMPAAARIVGFNTMSKFLLIPLSFKAVMEAIGTFIILFIGSAVRPMYDHQI